jgi:hypothetical protein
MKELQKNEGNQGSNQEQLYEVSKIQENIF